MTLDERIKSFHDVISRAFSSLKPSAIQFGSFIFLKKKKKRLNGVNGTPCYFRFIDLNIP